MSRKRYRTLSAYFAATRARHAEVAAKVGVSPSAISHYVRGKRIPGPVVALRLSEVCGVSLESLLSGGEASR